MPVYLLKKCLNSISTKYTVFARRVSSIFNTAVFLKRKLPVFQATQSTENFFKDADVAKQIVAQKIKIFLVRTSERVDSPSYPSSAHNSYSGVPTKNSKKHSLTF